MLRFLATVLIGSAPLVTLAAGGGLKSLDAKASLDDQGSLQRGAKLYVNYCLGCHSLSFMRYNRMGRDLGLTDDQVRENLLFAADRVEAAMTIAMDKDLSQDWFGASPPDLSVVARARGADWLYTYLVTFYRDDNPARPFGVNNLMFPDVAMPHVLWGLQGVQSYVKSEDRPDGVETVHVESIEPVDSGLLLHASAVTADGETVHFTDRLEITQPGDQQPGEFRKSTRDLVNFLVYVGEPAQLVRYTIGFWVLVFLAVFYVLALALYKEYWKDVH